MEEYMINRDILVLWVDLFEFVSRLRLIHSIADEVFSQFSGSSER